MNQIIKILEKMNNFIINCRGMSNELDNRLDTRHIFLIGSSHVNLNGDSTLNTADSIELPRCTFWQRIKC